MKLDPCVCHSWYVLHVTGYASGGHGITYKAMKVLMLFCHSWYVLHVTGYASVDHGITYKAMKVLMLFCNSWTARITANMLQRGVCIWLLGLVGTNKASSFIPNCASL